jgi:hypothetical protein
MQRMTAARDAFAIGGLVIAISGCTVAVTAPATVVGTPPPATAAVATHPPSPTPDMRPVPLPLDTFKGTVEDPAKATLTLEDALKAGRAITDNIIGPDPVARLMLISADTDKNNGGFGPTLAWVFVADDVKPIMGTGLPTTNPPVPYHGCLSWTMIDMRGRMIAQLQSRYLGPKFPPALPRS